MGYKDPQSLIVSPLCTDTDQSWSLNLVFHLRDLNYDIILSKRYFGPPEILIILGYCYFTYSSIKGIRSIVQANRAKTTNHSVN